MQGLGLALGLRRGLGLGLGLGLVGMAQSLGDAIAILCGKGVQPPSVADLDPADRDHVLAQWLDERILNPQARAILSALNTEPDPAARITKTAADAGIPDCAPLEVLAPRRVAGIVVPLLPEAGALPPLDQELPLIAVTTSEIKLDGAAVAGWGGPELVAEQAGKVTAAVRALRDHPEHAGATAVAIAIDATVPATVLGDLLAAVARGGIHSAELAVRVGPAIHAVTVVMSADGVAKRSRPGVGMLVAVADQAVYVASLSGEEGTLAQPVATVPLHPLPAAGTAIRAALAGVVARRWPAGAKRDPLDARVTVVAISSVPLQVVVELTAAVNLAPDGTVLFPTVEFARGID